MSPEERAASVRMRITECWRKWDNYRLRYPDSWSQERARIDEFMSDLDKLADVLALPLSGGPTEPKPKLAEKYLDAIWAEIPLGVKARIMLHFPDGLDPVRLALRAKPAPLPSSSSVREALEKAQRIYKRCALFPENSADGLMALLELRIVCHDELVPLLAALADPVSTTERSVVLAAEEYGLRCAEASGRKFDIGELVSFKAWFYAGARWAASHPGADVQGPQSVTMAATTERMFPIQHAIVDLPWRVIASHEAQAFKNHHQTLATLAGRGGLSACEAVAVLRDRPWHRMDLQMAVDELRSIVAEATTEPEGGAK